LEIPEWPAQDRQTLSLGGQRRLRPCGSLQGAWSVGNGAGRAIRGGNVARRTLLARRQPNRPFIVCPAESRRHGPSVRTTGGSSRRRRGRYTNTGPSDRSRQPLACCSPVSATFRVIVAFRSVCMIAQRRRRDPQHRSRSTHQPGSTAADLLDAQGWARERLTRLLPRSRRWPCCCRRRALQCRVVPGVTTRPGIRLRMALGHDERRPPGAEIGVGPTAIESRPAWAL
jgi:hypothetical protein